MKNLLLLSLLLGGMVSLFAQQTHPDSHYVRVAQDLRDSGLRRCESYVMLQELTSGAPHRLSGSEGAARAVAMTRTMMEAKGFENIHLESLMVPVWVRGAVEEAAVVDRKNGGEIPLTICALGGSIPTPEEGIAAEVVEVKSFEELRSLGPAVKGKIVFFNRPFDPTKMNTFEAYGGAVDQRGAGAIEAAMAGGVAALVRSMTQAIDDVPHTGSMGYRDSIPKVPAAAISTLDAEMLAGLLKGEGRVKVRMRLSCRTLPEAASANVLGEITGSERPHEVIVVSGHLDSWDKGTGAHDDGAGCVQAIEVVHLIKALGLHPKRTIRAVMYMNEENGLRGGKAYLVAPERAGETHIAATESDRGGFAPRGFTVHGDSLVLRKVQGWHSLFTPLLADRIIPGYSGVDVSPLVNSGVPGIGLDMESHRYFDYHHSDSDTIDKVHPRELEMGAIAQALLCYLISEEGL